PHRSSPEALASSGRTTETGPTPTPRSSRRDSDPSRVRGAPTPRMIRRLTGSSRDGACREIPRTRLLPTIVSISFADVWGRGVWSVQNRNPESERPGAVRGRRTCGAERVCVDLRAADRLHPNLAHDVLGRDPAEGIAEAQIVDARLRQD